MQMSGTAADIPDNNNSNYCTYIIALVVNPFKVLQ